VGREKYRPDKKHLVQCRKCKKMVPTPYMGLVQDGNRWYKPMDICASCAEARRERMRDEDGISVTEFRRETFRVRLRDGFWMLRQHGGFGV
jgi:hypothetical protein